MFKIIFEDDTLFLGGNLLKTRWNEIFKSIKSIEYYFKEKKLYLEGFDQYNHLVEATWDMTNKKTKIERTHLLVKYNDWYLDYTFNFKKNLIAVKKLPWEENKSSGWKIGKRTFPICKLT